MRRVRTGGVSILAGLVGVALYRTISVGYRREIQQARERVTTGSQIAWTSCGPIEYSVAGAGPPVLVVHGAGGGYDQGMEFGQVLVRSGFRVIAMSRFGYLRTPLPADASPAAQADAHACLLDALDVRSVSVIGASAGAPSSAQFALRHPNRIDKLVLAVPALYAPRPGVLGSVRTPAGTQFLFNTALKSDFLFWAAIRLARRTLIRAILATPPEVVERASSGEQARVGETLRHILPVSLRRLGLVNDGAVTSKLPPYELERIGAPTLVISMADDLFGTFDVACYTAKCIPKARFIGYPSGGHLWVEHQESIEAEIVSFLRSK